MTYLSQFHIQRTAFWIYNTYTQLTLSFWETTRLKNGTVDKLIAIVMQNEWKLNWNKKEALNEITNAILTVHGYNIYVALNRKKNFPKDNKTKFPFFPLAAGIMRKSAWIENKIILKINMIKARNVELSCLLLIQKKIKRRKLQKINEENLGGATFPFCN